MDLNAETLENYVRDLPYGFSYEIAKSATLTLLLTLTVELWVCVCVCVCVCFY